MLKTNDAIEARLIAAIDPVVEASKKGCSSFELTFEDSGEEYGLNAYWNGRDGAWDCGEADPLSLLLICENAEREDVKDKKMDNETLVSLACLLSRSRAWIQSFQDGWYGRSNSNTSITGYLLGRKLRLKYKE